VKKSTTVGTDWVFNFGISVAFEKAEGRKLRKKIGLYGLPSEMLDGLAIFKNHSFTKYS
jgi:hypothetical protein